jgi:NAD(P)-dependent dehydrogenase (short-subunit alcohol dehydrogenase family)
VPWQQTFMVNLFAPVELCRLAVPWMREHRGGSIINISGGGATSPLPNFTAYGTSKAALVRFSETLAMEVAGDGLRVNCVAPGVMKTALLDNVLAAGPEVVGAGEHQRLEEQVSSGGLSTQPGADLCVFLASQESEGISGKLISAVWDPWRSLSSHIEDLKSSDIYTLRRIVPGDRGKSF